MSQTRIGILGTGSFLPERVLSNHDLEKILDTNDEWIFKRTGIRERRIAGPNINASDLAKEASLRAMEMGDLGKGLGPHHHDHHDAGHGLPSGANWLEAKLGAEKAVSFDVTAACSGFVFGLSVAEQYLKTGSLQNGSGCLC